MARKIIVLLLAVSGLVGLGLGYVWGGLQSYAHYQQASLADRQHCGGQLPVRVCVNAPQEVFSAFYPSYLHTGSPVVEVFFSSLAGPQPLRISVAIAGFSQMETRTVSAVERMQSAGFVPPLLNGVLQRLTSDRQTQLQVTVTDVRGTRYYSNAIPLQLHSRRLMAWSAANRLRIAAWITPTASAVEELVTRATAYLPQQPPPAPLAMTGYSGTILRQVLDQVDAIFDALRLDYGLRCQRQGVPYAGPESTASATQAIRLPSEVLQQGSGSDVEVTLLLASAVESIGLHAVIVVLPDRTLLGVALSPDEQGFGYWDASQLSAAMTGDAVNIASDALYAKEEKQGAVIDRILVSEARHAGVEPML
ncbi:MAG: hypothetical protein IMW90_06235 [Thermogemmatispora sp.]|jgi:hypothetical protein|uniref:Uncharacterized protein n=1 Tax=Thermogemmatispora aurantia TaxID=2045279 RepID=A0A5J4KBX7_9CHLR|nr:MULTISPECIES: hypothetical protein [Thermogemmatispora]MBE3565311.1 hypothetical protein [Thermogemmatispora sp.]GER85103.1 hypothetical protein KTAU_37390 [Thermogemmatispora aurantia]